MQRILSIVHLSFQSFARRALTKINELSQLEAMSNTPESHETEAIFRNATVKVGKVHVEGEIAAFRICTASSSMRCS